MKTIIQKAVVGIIFDGDEFLLMKKQGTWIGWQFPQGKTDSGETEEQALVREIQEEAGLSNVKIIKKLSYEHDYWFTENGKKIHKFLTFFLVKGDKTEKVKVSGEHSEYKWCGFDEVYNDLMYNKEIFKKVIENDMDTNN